MQPTLELVEYLRENGTKKLEEQHRITIRAHKTYENLISLTYNQLKSDLKNPIVRQCRGIILDTSDNFQVISFPYEKFFNYCEGGAAKIDWKTARVTEKVDGSLMILYFYKDQWHISSSGTPDASGNVHIGIIPWVIFKKWHIIIITFMEFVIDYTRFNKINFDL
jgi:tRNA splicing ligase